MYPAVLASLMFSTVALSETILVPLGEDIQSAINSASNGDIVQLEAGTYVVDTQLDTAGKAITLRGAQASGASLTTIDSSTSDRAMQCVGGEAADTVIEQITFQTSNSSSSWSLIRILSSSPTLRSCTFVSEAGVMNINDGSPFFESCLFTLGGGMEPVSLSDCSASFHDCRFTSKSGGAADVRLSFGSHAFSDCVFENTGVYGSFQDMMGSGCGSFSVVFSGCDFSGSNSKLDFNFDCEETSMLLEACTFEAIGDSFGMELVRCGLESVVMNNCVFSSNQGRLINTERYSNSGFGSGAGLTMTGCAFHNNTGGMYLVGNTVITGCTFTNNAPSNGTTVECSFMCCGEYPQFLIEDCVFAGNAGQYGGAISSSGGLLTVRGCDFSDNSASESGGAIYANNEKAFRLQDTRLCGNTPDQISGGYLDLGGNCIETICVNCPDIPECPDSDDDGVCDEDDVCPGEPDQDTDADGVLDCLDECPEDPTKVTFGRCGCGVVDTTILGDFDCDGDFDQDDYLAMGKALGEDGCSGESGCSGDLNNDGVVDGADLTIILSSWGVCNG